MSWMADAESITFKTSQRSGVGTTFDCRTRIGPIRLVDTMSITRWIPLETMGVEHRGVVRGSGAFSLRGMGSGRTLFSWEERLTFPWWLGGPIGEWVARPVLTSHLARESHAAQAHHRAIVPRTRRSRVTLTRRRCATRTLQSSDRPVCPLWARAGPGVVAIGPLAAVPPATRTRLRVHVPVGW